MGLFKFLFGEEKKVKNRIYDIEINDSEINNNIVNLVLKIENKIKLFKEHLNNPLMGQKDEDLEEMYEYMLKIEKSVQEITQDVEKIIKMEIECKDYFIIKDDTFLFEKRQELEKILNVVKWFINVIQQRPSNEQLKADLFRSMVDSISRIGISINTIIKDDTNLKSIYKKLTEI
ncbi:MAG: hypothetical protein AB7V77_01605 [Candidatus Woesearchaeota archaeon]